jgi:Lon protease-like protein
LPTLQERYRGLADLPQQIAFFPLSRAILLPRALLPLQVFEPRYLEMLDDVMSSTRVLGIVQPALTTEEEEESPAGKSVPLRGVGCVGRVTAYQELEDGRLAIALTGIARCTLGEEVATPKPYRAFNVGFDRFLSDFVAGVGEEDVDRQGLLATLKSYLEARQQRADWSAISKSSSEALVNLLAIASPYGPEEKQALLEAPTLKARAEALVALAQMELAAGAGGSGSRLQ